MKKLFSIYSAICFLLFSTLACSTQNQISFCGKADNDLFLLLENEGFKLKRYNTPEEAVVNAPDKSGVIIVSDSYPEVTTDIEPKVYEQAVIKGLRVYVEYPSSFPGINISSNVFRAKLERGVVTSDIFSPNLQQMDILGINDCHTLIADVKHPLIVLAKVAGFDKAEYGINDVESYPLLF